jgi:Mg2+ and Co2+ transporter CorA
MPEPETKSAFASCDDLVESLNDVLDKIDDEEDRLEQIEFDLTGTDDRDWIRDLREQRNASCAELRALYEERDRIQLLLTQFATRPVPHIISPSEHKDNQESGL